MEYSKGDWKAKISKASRYYKAEVRCGDTLVDEQGHYASFPQLIAVCYGKNTVANAHLIAASPKLYEALRNLVERIDAELALGEKLDVSPARQALNKVEGKF